jgi:hypothetical protein
MKKFAFVVIPITLLYLVTSSHSAPVYLKLGGACYSTDPSSFQQYLLSGKQVNIDWSSTGISPQTKLKLTLLKNDAPLRVIATGLPLTNGYQNVIGDWVNDTPWTPANSDIGCNYKFQLSTEDNTVSTTGLLFQILPANRFVSQGKYTYVRLDWPQGGEVLRLGKSYQIKWAWIPFPQIWPSQKLKLELFYNNSKVSDIATVGLNFFNQCQVYGTHNWLVSSNLTAGNFYQIKISGDSSSWLSNNFIIAYPSPATGSGTGSKVPKVDQSGTGLDGPSQPPPKKVK